MMSLVSIQKKLWSVLRTNTLARAACDAILAENRIKYDPGLRQVWSPLLANIELSSEAGDNEICHGPRERGTKRFVCFLSDVFVIVLQWYFVSDHINHIRSVAGVDSVGIGASYDGINEWVKKIS